MRDALSLLPWLVAAPVVMAQVPTDVSLFGHGEMNGPMYNWAIPSQRLDAQPKWKSTDPTLPLPIPKAVAAAESWIKKKNPEVASFAVSSIAIAPVTCCGSASQDRWYYRVEFDPVVSGRRLYGGRFIAVVLFDGSVVEPRTEKR